LVEHIWSVLSQPQPTSPTSEIVGKWRGLPVPGVEDGDLLRRARAGCDDVYQLLHGWQRMLAESSSHDDEEALVLTEGSFQTSPAHEFRARISWSQDESPTAVKVTLETSVISLEGVQSPLVVWQQPRVRFRRRGGGRRRDEQTLAALLSAESARQFAFGRHPRGRTVEAHAFVTAGSARLEFDLPVPRGAREAEFLVDVKLDLEQGEDGVVRCIISDGQSAATEGAAATLLANPDGAAFQSWKAGVLDFARLLPEVSHREPAPSDRDPIPAPFDNTYNARERDHFHTKVKYHRDDRFLVEHILDRGSPCDRRSCACSGR
jgi:hypothetical protein